MRLISIEAENFASYDKLEFSFDHQGLALISGMTGSGKSTLQDVVPWTLFGITAKDGNSDDIRPWGNSSEPTKSKVILVVGTDIIEVHRVRGTQKQNDLYWIENESEPKRGKDVTETQLFIEHRINCDAYSYITACYYNEFNPASTFFSSLKASDRRELFESVVDLSFPARLVDQITQEKKTLKKEFDTVQENLNKALGRKESLQQSIELVQASTIKWNVTQDLLLEELKLKNDTFLTTKNEKLTRLVEQRAKFEQARNFMLEDIGILYTNAKNEVEKLGSPVCNTCNQVNKVVQAAQKKLEILHAEFEACTSKANPYTDKIEHLQSLENPHEAQLLNEKQKKNPFTEQLISLTESFSQTRAELIQREVEFLDLTKRQSGLLQLQALSSQMRSKLLSNTIKLIESTTNNYLDRYFDAEIRVIFSANDADNLTVDIKKSGYDCSYKQLSKGQKGLLKLCFSIAVMKAASAKSGTHYSTLFFDESLDGLDAHLKIKAYSLFEHLVKEHENVLIIDHSLELASLFEVRYNTTITGDISKIEKL